MELTLAPTASEATEVTIRPELTLADFWKAGFDMGLHSPEESMHIFREMRDSH